MASSELFRGAIFAASISVVCKCLFRCFESGVRCTVFAELFSAPHSEDFHLPAIEHARRTSEGRWHESQRPRGTATSDDLLLVAGAIGHGAIDHLFGSHGRHGHGLEEWPANGNHVPRLE